MPDRWRDGPHRDHRYFGPRGFWVIDTIQVNKKYNASYPDFRTLIESYIWKAEGILIVYSITSRDSFDYAAMLYQKMLVIKDMVNGYFPSILVANHCDKEFD